jgi:hypothetical protein
MDKENSNIYSDWAIAIGCRYNLPLLLITSISRLDSHDVFRRNLGLDGLGGGENE